MHVVHVIARLNDGGPARVIAALAGPLARQGIQVTVLAGSCDDSEIDIAPWLLDRGVVVERVPGFGRRVTPLGDLQVLQHLIARLRALAPDVVHTHTAKAGALGRLACRWLGLPCIHTYHGHVLSGYFRPAINAALAAVERFLAWGHHHHALTPGQTLDLACLHRIGRRGRWHCLPIPVTPVRPVSLPSWAGELRPRTVTVGFLGRLVPVKDVDLFLDTVALLAHRRPLQAVICGDGPLRAHVERRAGELALRVLCTGQVPAAEALAVMDVLLMTSRNEGLPLTAIEAGSAGVPVVAPAVGGLADIARWGGVVPAERTAHALAATVDRVLGDPRLQAAAVAGGRRLAARLDPEALAPVYAALYATVAKRSHRLP